MVTQRFIYEIDTNGHVADRYMVEADEVYVWDPVGEIYSQRHGLPDEQVQHLLDATASGCTIVAFSAEAERAARRAGWVRSPGQLHRAWREKYVVYVVTEDGSREYPGCSEEEATFATEAEAEEAIESLRETGWGDVDLRIEVIDG